MVITIGIDSGMNFSEKVIETVSLIPKGKVATYGQVASLISTPRAARQVGWILANITNPDLVPWQRVINAKGMISIESLAASKAEQARRLQDEGVEVEFRDGNYWVDLEKYLWKVQK